MGLQKVLKVGVKKIDALEQKASRSLLNKVTLNKPILKKTHISVNLSKLGVYN